MLRDVIPVAALMLFLVGCNPIEKSVITPPVITDEATSAPTMTFAVTATQTSAPTATPKAPPATSTLRPTSTSPRTATSLPTSTSDACPGLGSKDLSQLAISFPDIILSIQEYLEQGNPVAELPATFSRKSDILYENRVVGAMIVDLAGDGNKAVVVTITQGNWLSVGSSGAFVFQKCVTGKYSVHYMSADPESDLISDFTLVSVLPTHLLANNSTQLIVSYGWAVGGRCIEEIYLVIGLENDAWKTYLNDKVGCDWHDVTYVRRVIARDPGSDGRKGLMLIGTHWTGWSIYRFASRPVRVFYAWNGGELQFEKRIFLPSAYRFHLLQDAQLALEAGDVKSALESYQQAAANHSLKDSPSWFEIESLDTDLYNPASMANTSQVAHQYQTAFAYFRIIVLSAQGEQLNQLERRVEQITLLYPADKPGHEFAELALIFQAEFVKSRSKEQACQQVNARVESNYPNLRGDRGHIGNWGDEGEFTVKVICS